MSTTPKRCEFTRSSTATASVICSRWLLPTVPTIITPSTAWGEKRCVGHRQQRGSVHDHQEFLGELFDKLAHLVGTQQFGRVRRNTPGGKHKELGILYLVHGLSNIDLTGKNLRQTNFGVNV